MALSIGGCPETATRGRAPNRYEKEIFDLWDNKELNDIDIMGGKINIFLKTT